MSRQLKTNQYAYAAGLIDGEGCIQIRKTTSNRSTFEFVYGLTILVNQTDGESIDYMYGIFGGSVYLTKQYGYGNLPVYRWEIRGAKAAYFLKRVLPFLRIKKIQAELALRFQNTIRQANKGSRPLEKTENDLRHWYYEEMRRLKTIHHSAHAAVTTERENSSNEEMLQSELMGITTMRSAD